MLDFATGSGGFLVEAARRVIDDGGLREDDPRDLSEGLAAIVRGFHGAEIGPFPYYLTEVNLLLQVSRLLDPDDYTSLVWIGRDDHVPQPVVAALERWRGVLATRADFEANPQRRWFETHRTRDKKNCAGRR